MNATFAATSERSARRRIWLCADDYGISPAVDIAIRDLVVHGRLNATSVMVATPSFNRSEALPLSMLNIASRRVALGLHVTLTAPFQPLSADFTPLLDGAFLPIKDLLRRALLRQLRPDAFAVEVLAQIKAFHAAFARPPDFIDGHQHVHLFPQIRDGVLNAAREAAPQAWVRQCGRALPLYQRLGDRKGLLLDALSREFRRAAKRAGVRVNPAFAGTYDFDSSVPFADRFARFLNRLPTGGVVMCHPGFVDAELKRVDPLTTQREKEHAFFASDEFPRVLAAHGVALM
jgi:chitin disaccharide deacetylase